MFILLEGAVDGTFTFKIFRTFSVYYVFTSFAYLYVIFIIVFFFMPMSRFYSVTMAMHEICMKEPAFIFFPSMISITFSLMIFYTTVTIRALIWRTDT